ncbi:hypothetical protein [Enterococcus sp. AZ196]|uniref:hypothetical protein n=1 Tax=Enterococcus sp. AZ196 TaxID=2774659 RepID=UPI003D28C03B
MMTAEEYFGNDLVKSLKNLLEYAMQSGSKERKILIECLLKEIAKQENDIVKVILIKLTERIEQMG